MRDAVAERCGRCGGDPFVAGTPFTFWVWLGGDGEHSEARAVHLCLPCGREFPNTRERGEYLRLVAFAA
jgi:hypothetical protein